MDAIVNVRTNQVVKDRAQKILSSMGMNTSTAVNIFLRQVVTDGKMPFVPTTEKRTSKKR